jgi:EAL domain-containing protein (putative c-di-GMP-specific phosphodiesterase class I)
MMVSVLDLRVGESDALRQSPRDVSPGDHEVSPAGAPGKHSHLAVCEGRKSRDFTCDPYAPGALTTLFQPIFRRVRSGSHLVGVECLSRGPAGSGFESAAALFGFAREAGTLCSLDRACITRGLSEGVALPRTMLIFLNLHPETLKNDFEFPRFLETACRFYGIALDRVVIELLEYSRIAWVRPGGRCRSLGGLRSLGVRLALDDVHTNLDDVDRIADYEPDFIKIDGEVLRGSRYQTSHRRFMVAMLDLADRLQIEVIAEGVESEHDLRLVEAADISLVQGYLMGRPVPLRELPFDSGDQEANA